jgi:hypothetical protein
MGDGVEPGSNGQASGLPAVRHQPPEVAEADGMTVDDMEELVLTLG